MSQPAPIRPLARRHPRARTHRGRKAIALRPWSEVTVAGAVSVAAREPTHIKRSQMVALVAVALVLHAALAWYVETHRRAPDSRPAPSELAIDIVRPVKPPEPPKVEPPKPQVVKQKPAAQPLPTIQESLPKPSTTSEAVGEPEHGAPIAAPAPPAEEPVTVPIGRAGYLNNPPPNYPTLAVRQNWQGTVTLRVHVLASGRVDTVEVQHSSGRKLLDDEAIRTVKLWLFTPAKRGANATDGWATVPIEFSLEQ